MLHFTNKQAARDLFCKASPGTIDLIRTPGTVGTSFSVGDRVSRPIHETGFAKLVDQYIYIYICVCVCVCVRVRVRVRVRVKNAVVDFVS